MSDSSSHLAESPSSPNPNPNDNPVNIPDPNRTTLENLPDNINNNNINNNINNLDVHSPSFLSTFQSSHHGQASFTRRLADRGVPVPSSFTSWQHTQGSMDPSPSSGSLSTELDSSVYYGLSPLVKSSFTSGLNENGLNDSSHYTSLRHRYERESHPDESPLLENHPRLPALNQIARIGNEDSDIELSDDDGSEKAHLRHLAIPQPFLHKAAQTRHRQETLSKPRSPSPLGFRPLADSSVSDVSDTATSGERTENEDEDEEEDEEEEEEDEDEEEEDAEDEDEEDDEEDEDEEISTKLKTASLDLPRTTNRALDALDSLWKQSRPNKTSVPSAENADALWRQARAAKREGSSNMILPGDGSIDSLLRMAQGNNKPVLQPKNGLRSPRKHLLQAPVFQVVYANTIKDRYLFLFSDLLLICKPIMDESIIINTPVNTDSESRSRCRSTESSLFQIKNIVELSQITLFLSREDQPTLDNRSSMVAGGRQSLPAPRKMHPMLVTALRKFETSAESGVAYLIDKQVLTEDPLSIANFLFNTPDLSRTQLGHYLSDRRNGAIYEEFLNCFRLVGLRLDEALRILLTTFILPSQWESIEYIIEQFAKKWHDSNQNVIKFHEVMVVKVIVAMLFLNAEVWYDASSDRDVFWFARERKEREDRMRLLRRGSVDIHKHRGSVAFEPLHYISSMRTKGPRRPTVEDFLDRWKYYDQYELVEAEFLEEMYRSIMAERLETGWDSRSGDGDEQEDDSVITVDVHQLPSRLTKNVPCLPIRISIPSPDPGLQIKLRGQDLVCQPNILDFSQSAVQSFTVTGHTLGRTNLMFIKSGFNAGRYVSPTLPRTKSIVVERLFMRYTFQIGFYPVERSLLGEPQTMDRCTFSVENEEERHIWVDYLKRLCGRVSIGPSDSRPIPSRMSREEKVGLQVLREVLLAEDIRKHSIVRYSLFNKTGGPARNSDDQEQDKTEERTLLPSATHAVTKRGHEIVHLVVQNALVPRMLGFLKQQVQ